MNPTCLRFLGALLLAIALPVLSAQEASTSPAASAPARLHLVGDSTMADKPVEPPNPEHGWGQMLPLFFRPEHAILNHAINGRSTKSFIDEGSWDKVLSSLRPGDFVILQFGHNDEKREDPTRFAAPATYRANLARMIADVRAHHATPILATPVARRSWTSSGELFDTHGDYPEQVRSLAAAEHVPLIELLELTSALERTHGVEGSKKLHLWVAPHLYARVPAGLQDNTHYSAYGATRVAALAVQELIRLQLPPADWLR